MLAVLQLFSDGVLIEVLLVGCLEVGELVVWWSFAGCFSLGDGGLDSGGLKCGFTTGFWRGEGVWNWSEMEKKDLVVVTGE
uniref:Uncharacterized protein n=1 Tax=Solanum tuberosum TaxID=4113 RepID=M1DAX9_SOLTU